MKAIRFDASAPRFLVGRSLGAAFRGLLWHGPACTRYREVEPPALPGDDWVRVRTRYGGICGSDMSAILLRTSPYYSPFSSFPCTLGHECTGIVEETGDRVVVDPLLSCETRGLEPCDYCARGETNRCVRFTEGPLAPGMTTGFCRDTGGSFSASFVAHRSQLHRVPDAMSDEDAALVEPFACGVHAALGSWPADDEIVLVQGAGPIGLCTLTALRALGSRARIVVRVRHAFQAEAARRLGASEVIEGGEDVYGRIVGLTGASIHKPIIGKRVMVGGVDRTFECVGKDPAIDDALRLTRAGGQVVIVGVPGMAKGIDWSSIFVQELTVQAALTYHRAERYEGRTLSTFALALELMAGGKADLGWMVTHRFELAEYDLAFRTVLKKEKHGVIKAVFRF